MSAHVLVAGFFRAVNRTEPLELLEPLGNLFVGVGSPAEVVAVAYVVAPEPAGQPWLIGALEHPDGIKRTLGRKRLNLTGPRPAVLVRWIIKMSALPSGTYHLDVSLAGAPSLRSPLWLRRIGH